MVLNVEHASETSWIEVCKKVRNALVFIDDCSAECLHWHGGLHRLLRAGALGVREFSSFEGGTNDDKKAVFLVKNPLVGPPRMILRDIISNSSFEHCIVITSCSPIVLTLVTTGNVPESSQELTALHKLERDILHWMKNQEYIAEIFHFSYGFVPLNDSFFITPAFNNFFPCFDEDLDLKNVENSKYPTYEWEMESLPLEMQIAVTYLMSTLNGLLSQLNVREDIYCLGPMSTLVGAQLQKHSTSYLRSQTATPMSVLLIDRTLDLCRPVFFENDCILDLIKAILPPFPSHNIDVAVDMSSICTPKVEGQEDLIFPGCLHEPKTPMFEWLFNRSVPEILTAVSIEICKILSEEDNIFGLMEMEKIIDSKIADKFDLIKDHSGLLQFTLGIIQTLRSKRIEKIKLTRSFQILLMQIMATDGKTDEAICQITEIIKFRKSKGFELEHLFYILIFFYSFIGEKYEINFELETLLITAFSKAILEDKDDYSGHELLNFDSIIDADEFCEVVFNKLHSLKKSRKRLLKYREVAVYEDTMMPMEYTGVMTQLMQDVASPIKTEIPDLRHKPNLSLRDNFASRFSKLLNSTRPHITDNESLMVFVIGGITGQEVKLIKNFLRLQGKPVIIGSTALLSPTDIIKQIFLNDPLKPFSL